MRLVCAETIKAKRACTPRCKSPTSPPASPNPTVVESAGFSTLSLLQRHTSLPIRNLSSRPIAANTGERGSFQKVVLGNAGNGAPAVLIKDVPFPCWYIWHINMHKRSTCFKGRSSEKSLSGRMCPRYEDMPPEYVYIQPPAHFEGPHGKVLATGFMNAIRDADAYEKALLAEAAMRNFTLSDHSKLCARDAEGSGAFGAGAERAQDRWIDVRSCGYENVTAALHKPLRRLEAVQQSAVTAALLLLSCFACLATILVDGMDVNMLVHQQTPWLLKDLEAPRVI